MVSVLLSICAHTCVFFFCLSVFSCTYRCPIAPGPFLRILTSSPLLKSVDHIFTDLFLDFYYIFLFFVSIISPIPHSVDECSFSVSFEVR